MVATSYTRQEAANIVTGATIQASHFNNEYNRIQAAFDGTTGHDHSGGTGLGQPIPLASAVTGILVGANGGTGVANTGKTITLGGNFTTSGAFATTLTVTNTTGVTLPTTGTLATLAGNETFSNKALTSPVISGGTIDNAVIGGSTPVAATFTAVVGNSFRPTSSTPPTNGIYLAASNTIGISANSTAIATFDSSSMVIAGLTVVTGSSTAAGFIPSSNTVPTNGMYLSAANTVSIAGNSTRSASFTSTGLNDTAIGATTASTGKFTTLQATGLSTAGFVKNDSSGNLSTSTVVIVTVKKQVFTASGTYTPSTGVQYAMIECVGSGGGGGGCVSAVGTSSAGGGGGSGGYSRAVVTAAQIGASQTVTINNAGTGGAAGANNGTAGGSVSVGSLCSANGGSGGQGVPSGNNSVGGAGGTAGTGDLATVGMDGGNGSGSTIVTVGCISGSGGASYFGGGTRGKSVTAGSTTNSTGANATNYGGGGSGGASMGSATGAAGGDGSKGAVFITEYCNQ